jgi:hypothetical protein
LPRWGGRTTSLVAWRGSVKPRHFGVGASFVDEDEALCVKIYLPFEPLLTRGIWTWGRRRLAEPPAPLIISS